MKTSQHIGTHLTRLTAALLVIAAVIIGPALTPASAQASPMLAYVYAFDYTNANPYTPDDGYQYNSSGELNTVTHNDVGVFTVLIPKLQKESQTQLTTISENGERCKLAATRSVTGQTATEHTVHCFAIDGSPVDIGFFLLQASGGLVTPSAYVWANEPGADSSATDDRYQFNSAGEAITIAKTEAGTYTVALPGQGAESGTIQVTATNNDPGISCAVRRWEITAENLKNVEVNCFDSSGTRVDAGFELLYVDANDANAANVTTSGAFLIGDHSSVKDRYTPGKNFQFSSADAPGDSLRTEMGRYTVYLPAVGQEAGVFLVTASGGGDSISGPGESIDCTIPRWVLNGTDYEIDVVCFDSAGALVDSFFNLTYVVATSA